MPTCSRNIFDYFIRNNLWSVYIEADTFITSKHVMLTSSLWHTRNALEPIEFNNFSIQDFYLRNGSHLGSCITFVFTVFTVQTFSIVSLVKAKVVNRTEVLNKRPDISTGLNMYSPAETPISTLFTQATNRSSEKLNDKVIL